ncbi:MAG TPA: DNA repair protein RecO [Kofleriaceae bacterium]|nr:DNA repair protein RecO [Kofleriaceae bacterium]
MTEPTRGPAVVLRKVVYGEADVIATVLSREQGKLSALARSARRSQRRFGAALELFTVSRMELRRHRGSELWTLSSAETVESFADLAREVGALAHASYGTELARELSAPEQPEPELFDLLVELFRSLARRGARVDVLRAFELGLLDIVGLAPSFDACAGCGLRDAFALDRGAVLDAARGGAICSSCAAASRGAGVRPLGAGARAVLTAAQRAARAPGGLAAVDLGGAGRGDDAEEARDAMLALLTHHVGKSLKTVEFIGKLGRGP